VRAYGTTLEALGHEHPDLVVLDGDLAGDCGLHAFAHSFPDRFIEHGIAEQDMVSTAGGLAHQGLIPVVNSFAAFLASRANEQIYLNACDGARVVYVLTYAGLTPAGPGPTHQSLRDVSLLGATPGILVIQPSCEREAEAALRFAVTACTGSVALRLQLGPAPEIELPEGYTLEPGRGVALTEGRDAVLFAYGPVMLR
jgi:transketolase